MLTRIQVDVSDAEAYAIVRSFRANNKDFDAAVLAIEFNAEGGTNLYLSDDQTAELIEQHVRDEATFDFTDYQAAVSRHESGFAVIFTPEIKAKSEPAPAS